MRESKMRNDEKSDKCLHLFKILWIFRQINKDFLYLYAIIKPIKREMMKMDMKSRIKYE